MWRKEEDLEHIMEECKETGKKEEKWTEQIGKGRKTLARLKKIMWLRKEKEKEKEAGRNGEEFKLKWVD